ncbi:MAG TPA: ATP-dependent DNA helicase RecG [Bacilli bacterium]|nr:ATP-dependent DNA helicase RecG [Bacilli bacterium]
MREILLSELTYITPKQVLFLKKNNINTVEDLLFNYPTKFEDYTIKSFKDIVPETTVTIAGVVQTKATVTNVKTKLSVMNFYLDAEGRKVRASIFNRHFLKSKINYGTYVRLTGKFNENMRNFTAAEIHFNEFSSAVNPIFNIKGISDEKMLELKAKVYDDYFEEIVEDLPADIRIENNLIGLQRAIKYINIPEEIEEVQLAINRIKFEELFLYQLKIKYMLYMRKHFPQGISVIFDQERINNFIKKLPYELTVDQKQSLEEILGDMRAPYKMNRLLQGEVGSGKTIIAAIALLAVISAGYQGAIMVPTEVLANQHYNTFQELFVNEGINVVMLSSSVNSKDKKVILTDLLNKKVDIIIGTHSLFQKDVIFNSLGLVVTDEEHRFGVRQRVSIVGKGHLIDHLKMSATPIPRTLAISVLGESDISVIKTLPGNKKEAITRYVHYEDRAVVMEHMKQELLAGHQIYVVAPMIEESEVIDLQNATEIYNNMVDYFAGVCQVGLIHSRLKAAEKEQVMADFSANKTQILVSTSVIEVGVNVINATTMVILDADRFGIAQLHQMRGRVRRSDEQAYCFLVSNTKAQTAIDRVKLVEGNSDGFILAEEDLIIRGPGDFFGEKQSGMIAFKMADLILDKEILEVANELATKVIDSQKLFTEPEYQEIKKIVDDNYQQNKEMLN